MIPTEKQCKELWLKYQLSEKKQHHVFLVCQVALFLCDRLNEKNSTFHIDRNLLLAGALLHDIDKNIPRQNAEQHPQTGVRVLKEEGMEEVARLIEFHSVQYIEDPVHFPKTWEEKLLFLADKMVKQEIITVDERFRLWLVEYDLPDEQKDMLRRVYPKVKQLEEEIFISIGIIPPDVAQLLATREAL